MDIQEKAKMYADGRIVPVLKQAIVDAYIQGYNDACEEKDKPQDDLNIADSNNCIFLDMNLPSGTLWASILYKKGTQTMKYVYNEAKTFNLPTKEQWLELVKYCNIKKTKSGIEICSVDGLSIYLDSVFIKTNTGECGYKVAFWLDESFDKTNSMCVMSGYITKNNESNIIIDLSVAPMFKGEKLPVFLVKPKETD